MEQEKTLIYKTDLSTFQDTFTKLQLSDQKIVLIFEGSIDMTTGHSWCSDCVAAEAAINDTLLVKCKAEGVPVVICTVGDREAWMDK